MWEVDYRPGRIVTFLGVAALLTLAFSGYVKGSSYFAWLPTDLTLIAALSVVVLSAHAVLSWRQGIPRGGLLIALWCTCLAGLLAAGATGNDYAASKPVAVFIIAPLCILGGSLLLRSPRSRLYFCVGVVLIGLVVILLGRIDPGAVDAGDRLVSEGTSTINTGRAAGAAATVLAVAGLTSRRRLPLLLVAAVCALGAVAIASRGPVLAAAIAVVGVMVFARTGGRFLRLAVVAIGVFVLAQWALASGSVNARLTTVDDSSSEARRELWTYTLALMQGHPLGIGWGRLYEHVGAVANSDGWVQYPHNVFLEVASEGGWLAGVMLLVVVIVAVRRQGSWMHGRPVEMAMMALFAFAIVNACVSGDVNSNRGLWVAIGAALATVRFSSRDSDVLEDEDEVVDAGLERVDIRRR